MQAVAKTAPRSKGRDLSQIPSLPKVDTSITARVTAVVGDLVIVCCGDKRAGAFDLKDARNAELRSRTIKTGDKIEAYILNEDPRTGNLLLSVSSPEVRDRWRQLYPVGAQVEGFITKKTDEFIQLEFPRSTKGRIRKIDLPPGISFDRIAQELRIGQPVKCKVLGIFSRGGKKLTLTFD